MIRQKKNKPQMRDLSVNPENVLNLQYEVRKREERLRKQMLIRDEYNKRFSMLRTKKLACFWLVGGVLLSFGIMYAVNAILVSAGFPSAIPI